MTEAELTAAAWDKWLAWYPEDRELDSYGRSLVEGTFLFQRLRMSLAIDHLGQTIRAEVRRIAARQ